MNDSEVLFWLLVRNTHEHDDPLVGYVRTVEDLVRIWEAKGRPAIPSVLGPERDLLAGTRRALGVRAVDG